MATEEWGEEGSRFLVRYRGLVEEYETYWASVACVGAIAEGRRQTWSPERVVAHFAEGGAKERPRPLLGHHQEHPRWRRAGGVGRRHETQ